MAQEASKKKKSGISILWVVPLVALAIGSWLGYKSISEKGPTITIELDSAEGIAVQKTKIRYKEVEIGKVVDLRLSPDLNTVYVTAELLKHMKPHLSENTQFWVVSPQVSISKISGLSTLLSGVYIAIEPGKPGTYTHQFKGLKKAPIDTSKRISRYILRSKNLGSIYPGSPIYYREIKAGEIIDYSINEEDAWIEVNIFIEEPYSRWVNPDSHFWNISGIKVDLNAEGISAETGPLASLLLGGIAFDEGSNQHIPATENSYFYLYPNLDAVIEGDYTEQHPYLLYFNESIRGLKVGSNIEYKGIKVGEVTNIELYHEPNQSDYGVKVEIDIEPQRIIPVESVDRIYLNNQLKKMVSHGLRAQLRTGSLLTGALFIELVENDDEMGLVSPVISADRPSIPTIPGQFVALSAKAEEIASKVEAISDKISKIAGKVEQMPLEEIGTEIQLNLKSMRKILSDINRNKSADHLDDLVSHGAQASKKLNDLLDDTSQLIKGASEIVGTDTQAHDELIRMMKEIRKAARSVDSLTSSLNRKPESLIYGKGDKK